MIDVIVCGACGRMGRLIIKEVLVDGELNLIGAVESDDNPDLGRVVRMGVTITPSSRLPELLGEAKDVVIMDFTEPQATVEHMRASGGANSVIGTTGLTDGQIAEIKKIVEERGSSSVLSPNFSPGMNVLWEVSRFLAQKLEGYDVEIVEAHHRTKKDAPSGSAKRIAEIVGGDAPIHSIRAGDIAGDHMLLLAGQGERIELIHRAHSRECFASGAIRAAKWIAGRRDGKIHSMQEVLGIC
jgi:4-hydroxy-tetrahydrodipicolinate reductase